MSPENRTSHYSERYIALTLRVGAYGSFAILLIAMLLDVAGRRGAAEAAARAGILLLMATPTLRIIAAIIMYAVARDKRMILVSIGVLTIVVVSSLVGLNLH